MRLEYDEPFIIEHNSRHKSRAEKMLNDDSDVKAQVNFGGGGSYCGSMNVTPNGDGGGQDIDWDGS